MLISPFIKREHSFSCTSCVRRAFTLIEILVVIAIVMILSAILLPVFNGARESARIATCSNNLKQIGLAINQYVQDSGGFYPNSPSIGNCGWASSIYPYLKSEELLQCPSLEYGEFRAECPATEVIEGAGNDGSAYYENWDGSYNLSGNSDFRNFTGPISSIRVKKPSDRILAFDGLGQSSTFEQKPPTDLQNLREEGYNRHRDGLNALFFDGHVKWISFDNIYDDKYWTPRN